MAEDLGSYRKSYERNSLTIDESAQDPFDQFKKWFKEVEESQGVDEVNAMTLATIGKDGFPKSRVVLLKEYDKEGFIFYTNYNSEKGEAIEVNPNVCISFFWPNLERQVIIKGKAEKVPQEQSVEYFQSRPKGSQLGAIASPQSKVISGREFLSDKLSDLEEKYRDKTVPKPENWGGFRVIPLEFEFWQGRPNRLHDRVHYYVEANSWKRETLAP